MVLPNIVAAGIYDSKFIAKNAAVSKKRKTTMFEIELPIMAGGISYIEDNSSPIRPNMVILAKPNQTRHTKFPFRCYYIHMIVPEGVLYDTLMGTQDFWITDRYAAYEKLFGKIVKHYASLSENEEILLQSLVLELIYTMSKDSAKNAQNKKSATGYAVIEKAVTYIKGHLTEDLCLDSIAKEMSLSPVYFHKMFKSAVGKTLRDFVEEQRVKKAISLLQTTDWSLTKIAFECGFSSQSYFSYVFRRRMKMPPRKYVQELYKKYEL